VQLEKIKRRGQRGGEGQEGEKSLKGVVRFAEEFELAGKKEGRRSRQKLTRHSKVHKHGRSRVAPFFLPF
jgi:hypothetical protein